MTHRSVLLAAAGLAAAATIAGCASSTGGTASFAGRGPSNPPSGLPSGIPSGFPTNLPSNLPSGLPSGFPTDLPSGLPTSLPTGASDDNGPSASSSPGDLDICGLLGKSQLRDIFDAEDVVAQKHSTACSFVASSKGIAILVDTFHSLTAAADKAKKGGTDVRIAGHPGVVLKDGDVVVSLGRRLQDPGEVYAFNDSTSHVDLAKKLLAKIVPHVPN